MAAITVRCLRKFEKFYVPFSRMMSNGDGSIKDPGSGVGKGGGGGGDIRSGGGVFGKIEYAREEQFFRKQQDELLQKMKTQNQEQAMYHDEEIAFHQASIKRHAEALERHKVLRSQHEAAVRGHEDEAKQILREKNGKK